MTDIVAELRAIEPYTVWAGVGRRAADEIERLRREVERLKGLLAGYESWERSVNEALNSGDGSYRP